MSVHNSLELSLRRAHLTLNRRINAAISEHKITADQYTMLSLLVEEDGVTQRQIVDALGSDSSTVAAMAQLLVKRGAIRKEPSSKDRRAKLVFLTKNGRELHELLSEVVQPIRNELHESVGDSIREILGDTLDEIAKCMKT